MYLRQITLILNQENQFFRVQQNLIHCHNLMSKTMQGIPDGSLAFKNWQYCSETSISLLLPAITSNQSQADASEEYRQLPGSAAWNRSPAAWPLTLHLHSEHIITPFISILCWLPAQNSSQYLQISKFLVGSLLSHKMDQDVIVNTSFHFL